MNRQQLAHILRSACKIVGDKDVLVIGSQSILGSYDEDELPPEATASIEADIAFLDDPDREKADQVECIIGELSGFHALNGFYAEGIHVDTAILPEGWLDRLVSWDLLSSAPAEPHFLEPHDLAVSKLAAGRQKDRTFVDALIDTGMLDVVNLLERNDLIPSKHQSIKDGVRSHLSRFGKTPNH